MDSASKKEQPMIAQKTFLSRRLAVSLAVICCAAFAAPSAASAAQRYAAPSGGAAASCGQADPCSLQTAVESAANGDEVIVGPGTYNEGADSLHASVTNILIKGAAGEPRPQINFGAMNAPGFMVSSPGTANVSRLAIDYAGTNSAFRVSNSTGVAEQLAVRTTTGSACEFGAAGYTLRDSVCATTKNGAGGIMSINYSAGTTWNLVLRNVTTVATGSPGWGIFVSTDGTAKTTIDAKNVIAGGGTGGSSADVLTDNSNSPTSEAIANLSHSNYDSRCQGFGGCLGGPGSSVTAPGSPTNQTDAPVFSYSDFHQADNSPTRDQGTTDPGVGTEDIDGDQRALGSAVDIGADEFVPPAAPPPPPPPPPAPAGETDPPPPPPVEDPGTVDPPVENPADTDPPETTIKKAPPASLQRTTAGFRFVSDEPGSTFRCKLDRGAFRPCASGRRYRHLTEGKHRFQVAAVDAVGNADPTAARAGFRVVAP